MKLTHQLVIVSLILLAWNGCRKEDEKPTNSETKSLANEQLTTTGAILLGCDDTTAFKSSVDLQPLEYLRGCYSCTAVKEVPGLGEIPWVGNCQVYVAWDTVLQFRFLTYEPYFEELLLREDLSFNYVSISVGVHPVYDNYQFQQNPGTTFGYYARLLDDGDVGDAGWTTDTICTNYIEITRLDLEDREIEGKFELHLKMVVQGTHGILYSERINFLNGRFKAEIEN